jgi:hypothetical protein
VFDVPRLARLYGLVLGAGLLLEGGVLLLLDVVRTPTGDTRHNALHVVWGVTILLVLWPKNQPYRTALVLLVFGVFYSLLAVAGVAIDKPFGLLLGPGENAFHFIVGPLALVLGIWSLIQLQRSSSSASNADAEPSSAVAGSGDAPR